MYVTPEQIQAAGKANVEALLAVANAQFAAFEKLATINASAVKSAFEDSIANTRALIGAKDVQEVRKPAERLRPARHREGHRLLEERVRSRHRSQRRAVARSPSAASSEWNENFVYPARQGVEERAGRLGRRGRRAQVDARRGQSAYDNINKVAKQATEIAEANVAAATETVKGLAKAKKAA